MEEGGGYVKRIDNNAVCVRFCLNWARWQISLGIAPDRGWASKSAAIFFFEREELLDPLKKPRKSLQILTISTF